MTTRAAVVDGKVGEYARKRYRSFFQRLVDRREQGLLRRLLAERFGSRIPHVVDLPCGYGRFHELLKGFHCRITSLDVNPHMVALTRDTTQRSPADRTAEADVLQRLPKAAEDADLAFCIRLLQHLHDSDKRSAALRNLRGPGRPVLVSYYDRACLHAWTKRLASRLTGRPVRIRMIARRQFEAEVARAGLRVRRRVKLLPLIHAQTFTLLEPVGGAATEPDGASEKAA